MTPSRVRRRGLLVACVVGTVALIAALAFLAGSAMLTTQATYTVSFAASPQSSCWMVTVDVDFTIITAGANQSRFYQCGGATTQVVPVGACRTRILVSADFGIFEPAPGSELYVKILRNGQVVQSGTFNGTQSTLHRVQLMC